MKTILIAMILLGSTVLHARTCFYYTSPGWLSSNHHIKCNDIGLQTTLESLTFTQYVIENNLLIEDTLKPEGLKIISCALGLCTFSDQ